MMENFEPVEIMSFYVAYLRALYQLYQEAHWKSKGSSFYGLHLLYQRLYESTQETVDEAAEKTLGIFGQIIDYHDVISDITSKFAVNAGDDEFVTSEIVENLIKAEKMFLILSQQVYDQLEQKDALTLGIDDLIMSIASKHETSIYLLNQTCK